MWKVLIPNNFSYMYLMDDAGLVQDFWEVKYTVLRIENAITSRWYSWVITNFVSQHKVIK